MPRLFDRLKAIGAPRLVEGANKASAFFVRGGAQVWARGMLEEINKGLRNRFEMSEYPPWLSGHATPRRRQ